MIGPDAGIGVDVVARIRVEPKDWVVEVRAGESLLAAAERGGLSWPTVCHGLADCTACFVEVVEHGAVLGPLEPLERTALERLPERRVHPEREHRLACQIVPTGDAVVRKRGVRAARGTEAATEGEP